jgi:hypothetical protein
LPQWQHPTRTPHVSGGASTHAAANRGQYKCMAAAARRQHESVAARQPTHQVDTATVAASARVHSGRRGETATAPLRYHHYQKRKPRRDKRRRRTGKHGGGVVAWTHLRCKAVPQVSERRHERAGARRLRHARVRETPRVRRHRGAGQRRRRDSHGNRDLLSRGKRDAIQPAGTGQTRRRERRSHTHHDAALADQVARATGQRARGGANNSRRAALLCGPGYGTANCGEVGRRQLLA